MSVTGSLFRTRISTSINSVTKVNQQRICKLTTAVLDAAARILKYNSCIAANTGTR